MAINKKNLAVIGMQGMLGKMLVFKSVRGKTVVSMRPVQSGTATEAQLQVQQNFKEASRRAVKILEDAALKLYYESFAKGSDKNAYNWALKDCLSIPEIKSVDTKVYFGNAGESIWVKVVESVGVYAVTVSITDSGGQLVEAGEAEWTASGEWLYSSTVLNPNHAGSILNVIAVDAAGNKAEYQVSLY